MDLDDKLSQAFATWSAARDELARLRGQLPKSQGGQFAASPELAALFTAIQAQESVCEDHFAALLAVADQRAVLLEQREADDAARRAAAARGPGNPT
jgi:hypothetical protein